MAPPRRLHGRQARVGAGPPQALAPQPQHARQRGRLPDQCREQPARAPPVQRRRRQQHPLLRALGPRPPVGLPGQDPRRGGRGLAVHLRGPPPVLRRGHPPHRRLGPGGRPVVPRRPHLPAAAAADWQSRPASGPRHGQARLALVAGPQRHLLACLPQPARLPAVRRLRVGLPRRRQGHCRPDLLAGRDFRRRGAHHRRPGPLADRRRRRAWSPAPSSSTATAAGTTRERASRSWPPTASVRRGSCSTPRPRPTPMVSPTPRAWSASG